MSTWKRVNEMNNDMTTLRTYVQVYRKVIRYLLKTHRYLEAFNVVPWLSDGLNLAISVGIFR